MGDAWVPLSKLAVLAGVSEPTTRRYVASKTLSKFFRTRREARLTLVHVDAVPILKRAYLLSCQGKKMEEIETIIPQEFPIIFDSEPSAPPPAQAHDRQSSPPIDLESLQVLAPLVNVLADLSKSFEKLVMNQERILDEMRLTRMALEASQGPQEAFKGGGHIIRHVEGQTGQDKPQVDKDALVVDRQAVIARVMDLHGEGLGQHAITTRLRREGLRMAARGQLSKSTVARIIKGKVK